MGVQGSKMEGPVWGWYVRPPSTCFCLRDSLVLLLKFRTRAPHRFFLSVELGGSSCKLGGREQE